MYDYRFLSSSSVSRENCIRCLRVRIGLGSGDPPPLWLVWASVAGSVGIMFVAVVVGCIWGMCQRPSPAEKEMREFSKDARRKVKESCEAQDELITRQLSPPTLCEQIILFEHNKGYYSEYEYTLNFKKEEGRDIAWKISGEGKVKSYIDYKTDKLRSTDPSFRVQGKLSPAGKAYWNEYSDIPLYESDNPWVATWFGSFDFDTSFFEGILMCSRSESGRRPHSVRKGTLKSMDIESVEEWKEMRRLEREAGV